MKPAFTWSVASSPRRLTVGVIAVAAIALGVSVAQANAGVAHRDVQGASCVRPYTDDSPWNTPIGGEPVYSADSASQIGQINGPLTSDPTQFTYPVYAAATARRATVVSVLQAVSDIRARGAGLVNKKTGTLRLPLPKSAKPTSDLGQLIVLDPASGQEWGVFGLGKQRRGWTALFGYRFSTNTNGIPAIGNDGAGLASRAGASYLAGLVRSCEVASGKIEHALALAYDSPSIAHITPLRGTNGTNGSAEALPIGARIQLDPALTQADLAGLGCAGTCYTLAQAMQKYGAFIVGRSGRPKIYVEHSATAKWKGGMTAATASAIPVDRLRVLDLAGEFRIAKKFKRSRARAGKVLTASLDVVPADADIGAGGRVFCVASLGEKRTLAPTTAVTTTLASGNERASCAWRVPADAKGAKLDVSFQVVYQHGGVRNDFSLRVTR